MQQAPKRETISESVEIGIDPAAAFAFIRRIENLQRWSWFRRIRSEEANLFQAEDAEGPCRFFWIEDATRHRVILQKTHHKDAPCLVLSIGGRGHKTRLEAQFSSFRITPTQRLQLAEQSKAIKRLLEQSC